MGRMTARAYAITTGGRLLLDTVRASESDAREAAIRLVKQPGGRWKDLERDGHRVVPVHVSTAAASPADGKRRDLTAPRDIPGWSRAQARHEASSAADHRPVRRRV
jgi:hypothetical protein